MSWLLVFTLIFSGCANIFSGIAKTDTDEALFEDAQKLMNNQKWDLALAKFNSMSAAYKARTDVIEAWASTHAGNCGLDFINYFTSLGSADLSNSTIMVYLMKAWSGKAINAASCTSAQAKLEEISPNPANRTAEQNLFMAILGLVKMGVFLRSYVDRDGTNNLGDGLPDASVNVCTNDATNFPDAALDEYITGFGLLTSNLIYLTAALSSGSISGALTAVNSICSNPVVPAGTCGKTDATTINNTDRTIFRALLKTSATHPSVALGVGNCNTDDPTTGFLACCP